jgi:hypothetical protein
MEKEKETLMNIERTDLERAAAWERELGCRDAITRDIASAAMARHLDRAGRVVDTTVGQCLLHPNESHNPVYSIQCGRCVVLDDDWVYVSLTAEQMGRLAADDLLALSDLADLLRGRDGYWWRERVTGFMCPVTDQFLTVIGQRR